ncbi:MAG: glycerophosphodiester phosphodiesterase family protein [Lachnospiraceae bacterium]|nr:glycerophosphodiester phosphodiesterase family protein [Lachnospiraceae bacterium]MDD6811188.1 glycerophosphodiester phosphodiesterase family protein [Lachnospiraceae bacterium]
MTKILKTIIKISIGILCFFAVITGVWAGAYFHRSSPSAIQQYETTNPYIQEITQISAHRSGAGIMPEETMMAFKNCVENADFTVDFFEFDLHITKDGVLVLLHDDELDRTSDCEAVFQEANVRPENKTYEELRMLNMGAKFITDSGEMPYANLHGSEVPDDLRILSLDEVLDYLTSQGNYNYIIEIKNEGELGKQGVDILYTTLKEHNLLDSAILGCFHPEVSDYMDTTYPDMKRGAYTAEVKEFYIAALTNQSDYTPSFDVLQLPFGSMEDSYGLNLATAQIINYAHKNDLAVQYWTINNETDMEYLIRIGADCIMSDYPDVLYSVRSSITD